MAKGKRNTTKSESAFGPEKDFTAGSRSGVKELQTAIDKLASSVSTLTKQFQTVGNGSRDIAQQIGASVINAQDLENSTDRLLSLRDRIQSTYKSETAQLKVTGDVLNTLGQSALNRSNTELELAKLNEEALYKRFVSTQKLDGLSKEAIQFKYQERRIEEQLKALRADSMKQTGEQKTLTQDLIQALEEEKKAVKESFNTRKEVDKILKAQTHELEKQKILEKSLSDIGNKFTDVLGGAGEELLHIGHSFKESMISPMALVGALVGSALEEYSKIGASSREFLNTTGLTVDQTEHLRHNAHELSLEMRAQGVEMKDVFNAQAALIGQYGTLNSVTDVAVEKVVGLKKAFGVTEEAAAGVIYQMQKSAGASAETAGNVAALGADFAKAAGVAPDAVMKDIAGSSEAIAQYFHGTPADLMRTAVEARRLGLNIQKVADISKNLLNFESSIEDQMTASVLLGREINLDKARQLAMEGKIQEAAEETLKQVGSLADFNKMNAVQKDAIAKAAGMTVGDLQQSLEKQEAIAKMSSTERAEYERGLKALQGQNMTAGEKLLKEQRNQLTQEKIADAVAKISEIFANVILPVLEPIFDLMTGIFGVIEPVLPFLKTGLQLFLGYKLAVFLMNTEFFKTRGILGTLWAPFQMIGKGIKGAKDGIMGALTSTKEWFTKAKEGEGVWAKLKGSLSGVGTTLKSLFIGKGPKEWGKDAEKSFETAKKAGGGFFDKMMEWMDKFSFDPMEDEADDLGAELQDLFDEEIEEAVTSPVEDAADKLKDTAKEKITEAVSPEGAVESATESLQGMAQEKGEEVVGSIKESVMPDKVSEATENIQVAEAEMVSSPGQGIKDFLNNLSEGLKSMGQSGVAKGALNTMLAGPAFLIFTAAAPGLLVLSAFNGKKLGSNLYELAFGLVSMNTPGVKGGIGNLALAAGAFLIMTAGAIGLGAVALLGHSAGAAMVTLATGLKAMGSAGVLKGTLGLAALGASLIPAILAFGMIEDLDIASIITFTLAISTLAGVATLLGSAGPALLLGAAGIAALGVALIPAAYSLKMIQDLDPETIITFGLALSGLAGVATLLGLAGPALLLGSVGIAALGAALIPATYAFKLIEGLDANSITVFSSALTELAAVTTLLGIAAPLLILGSGGIAALGFALRPAAETFKLIAGLDIESIKAFSSALSGIAIVATLVGAAAPLLLAGSIGLTALGFALIPMGNLFKSIAGIDPGSIAAFSMAVIGLAGAAAGIGLVAPLVLLGSAALAGLGVALLPVVGVMALAAPVLNMVSTSLQTLSDINTDSLYNVGGGLLSIASGLSAIGVSGLLALPVLAGLSKLTPALEVLGSLFGSDEKESKPATTETKKEEKEGPTEDTQLLLEKMDQLIAAITAAGEIKLDAKKVGEVLAINTVRNYKIS